MTALKPCPFCGGKKFTFWWGRYDSINPDWYDGTLECKECGARVVKSLNLSAINDSDAKKYRLDKACCEAWNRRVEE